MEVNLLDEDLIEVGTLDGFKSLIWTDRYWLAGDFEIGASPNLAFINMVAQSRYLETKDSEHAMTIEELLIHYDMKSKNDVTVKGRSIETIIDRRITWFPTVLSGNFQDAILLLLNQNAINPTDPDRKINLLEFEASVDPAVTAVTIDTQFYGDNLYKVISDLCASKALGWKITITEAKKFRFKLYAGKNRSYGQFTNPYVTFSSDNENLLNADYHQNIQPFKTTALVAGETGVGNGRTTVTVSIPGGAGTDLDRRELFVDAKGVTRSTSTGDLTEEEYAAQLEQKGLEELAKNEVIETFEGQVDTTGQYIPGRDFDMGDILEVADEFGHEGTSRVVEIIRSQDPSGIKVYPTFAAT